MYKVGILEYTFYLKQQLKTSCLTKKEDNCNEGCGSCHFWCRCWQVIFQSLVTRWCWTQFELKFYRHFCCHMIGQ